MPYILDLTIQDNLWKETIIFMSLFSIFFIAIALIAKRFEIRNNWDRMRCRPEVMQYAWLYGIDPNKNMEYCLENAGKQVKQNNQMNQITSYINKKTILIDASLNRINNSIVTLDKNVKTNTQTFKDENKERAINIHSNIEKLKEGIQKVIAGLLLQNQMKNGILKTTNEVKLLRDAINK